MSIKERIEKIVAENKTPDQTLCPNITIYWSGTNRGGDWMKKYTPINGNVIDCDSSVKRQVNARSTSSYGYDGIYMKNHDGLLECARVRMESGNRAKQGEVRTWEYVDNQRYYKGNHFFIDRKNLAPYGCDGERIWDEYDGKFYNREVPKWFTSNASEMVNNSTMEQFNNWTGGVKCLSWNGDTFLPMYVYNCADAYKRITDRPVTVSTRYFLDIELPKEKITEDTISFSIINDRYCIFRCYKTKNNYSSTEHRYVSDGNAKEICRVYVDNKGTPKVCQDLNGWTVVSKQFDSAYKNWVTVKSKGFDKLNDWKPISWVRSIVDNDDPRKFVNGLVGILRHPVIEKTYKSGYPNLAKAMFGDTILANAKAMFAMNNINEKENIYKMLGVNKYMLKLLEDRLAEQNGYRSACIGDIVYAIKDYLGKADITDLSKESCDAYYKIFSNTNGFNWRYQFGISEYRWRRNTGRYVYEGIEDGSVKRVIERLCKLEEKDPGCVEAWRDARTMYNHLTIKPELSWDFRNREDIMQIHDNLQALKQAQDERYRRDREARTREEAEKCRKKFEKLQKDRVEKYECEGEKYQILVPHDLVEITREGSELRHCVGGYLQRHANGDTNIIFLRSKENPTVPFYTIEVKDDYVVQIHGKCNRWLGNDPEAISFVWKWIKDRGFKCEKYKLLDTASGYGKSGKEVSESYLIA